MAGEYLTRSGRRASGFVLVAKCRTAAAGAAAGWRLAGQSGARPDGHQVIVVDRPNVCRRQRDEGLGTPGGRDKLDRDSVGATQLDDGAQVTATKRVSREVSIEDDHIE